MSLIKKIKQFINGSWQEFSLSSGTLDNVVDLDSNQSIYGEKSFGSLAYFSHGLAVHREATIQIGDISIGKDDNGLLYTTGDNGGKIATRQWVEGVIAGKVDYLGVVATMSELNNISSTMNITPGDYCRFSTSSTDIFDIGGEIIHSGDLLVAKQDMSPTNPGFPIPEYWDIIHTEDPGEYVTLATDQTITGKKTFDGTITLYDEEHERTFELDAASCSVTIQDPGYGRHAYFFDKMSGGTVATQEWLNIINGESSGSIQQKGYASKDGYTTLGAIAGGEGAVAFGGQRFDKVGKPVSEEPQTEAKGKQSFAAGGGCITTGAWGVSLGKENLAYQKASFAMGGGNQAGYDLKRYQDDNGYDKTQTDCDNAYSFAFVGGGERNKAVGYASFATGSNNLSRHTNTFTAGQNNEAMGRRSSIFGYSNYTYTENGFVVGQYNERNDAALFQVGNGTGTSELRQNAFEVLKDGRAKVYGAPIDDNDVVRKCDLNKSEPLTPFETDSHVDTLTYAVKNLKLNHLYRVIVQPMTRQGVVLMDITNGKSVDANFGGSLDFIYYPFGNDNPNSDWYNVMSYGNLYLEVDGVRYGNAHIRTRLTLTESPYPEDGGKNIFAVQVILDSGDPNQLYYFPAKSIRLMEVR